MPIVAGLKGQYKKKLKFIRLPEIKNSLNKI